MRKVLARVLAPLAAAALLIPAVAGGSQAASGSATYSKPVLLVGTDPGGTALGNGERQAVGEPSIKLDSAGSVFITGADTVTRPAPAWFSNDQKTFHELESPGQLRERSNGAEGDFAIDDQDHVYMIDTGIPYLVLTRWSDHGHTWDYTIPFTVGVLPGLDDRPWLAWTKDTLWLYVNHGTHISLYKSTDEGFHFEQAFTTIQDGQTFFPGMIAADRSKSSPHYGNVYLFGNCGDYHSLCSETSSDGGATWRHAKVPPAPRRQIANFMVAVDVDEAGNVYGVWAGRQRDGCDVYLTVSRNGGRSWSPPATVSRGGGCATFPWVAAGGPGKVAIAYYQETSSDRPQDQVAKRARWYLHVAYDTTATRPGGLLDTVADPLPVHVGPLNRELWDFLQLDIGPDGRAHVAYSQDTHSGPDGPVGSDAPVQALGAQRSKDVMYVKETSGPDLG